jgi:L-serine dehydratase
MFLSTFDIFKIGIGPSSSHTMGPMLAASRFLAELRQLMKDVSAVEPPVKLAASLHGSLAFTGKGHATDRAVMLGLLGCTPETLDPDAAEHLEADLRTTNRIRVPGVGDLEFRSTKDLVFDYGPPLPGHANGLILKAIDRNGNPFLARTYYSIGGGFVLTEQELGANRGSRQALPSGLPFPFSTAEQMLDMGWTSGKTIAEMKRANEVASGIADLDARLDRVWAAMNDCIDRGLRKDGILPGGLKVRRRAKGIHDQLIIERRSNSSQPHVANEWMSVYAMAVNEENAAGGRVVTSPTNGAAGVVPAVMRYYIAHCVGSTHEGLREFLLVAAAIGGLIKHNASISGAEVGCQGEVGSASAMAAAGLCAALGGSNEQIENAAEIALEHHLGMTCDPAGGLVQVPCIERNGLGAIKAVAAASLALRGDGTHIVPLDNCIETMRQTGIDMNVKYKETSQGGLAVNLPGC